MRVIREFGEKQEATGRGGRIREQGRAFEEGR